MNKENVGVLSVRNTKKNLPNCTIKGNKGITLVALIITIIVLLILAVVAIRAVQGEGIISKAKESQTKHEVAQDEEQIKLALNGWKIEKNINSSKTFLEFMSEKFGVDKVTASGENEVTVTLENGNKYKVKEDGAVTSIKGVVLSKSKLILELKEGETITQNLTASLNEIEGRITWSNSDNSKATISAETGESITVTAVAKGSTTITAKCGDYQTTCLVIVEEPIPIGSYVQYNVPYADMYSGIEYTQNNGWRYLGRDDDGNKLIVSTAIPAILYYHYNENIGNAVDGGANSWWATTSEISSANTPDIYRTDKGYDYYTDSGEPGRYAAYGLRYKFESIPFSYQASGTSASTANTGIFRKVGSTTSGNLPSTAFRASGVNVLDVHNLTLAEANEATSKAASQEGTVFKDLTGTANGLFDMGKLDNYGESTKYCYWFADPSGYRGVVYAIISGDVAFNGNGPESWGIRPVVTLLPDANLTVINN